MPEANDPTVGDPLDAVIAEYVQQVEAGGIPDREALLARHPELAERLRVFFADYDRLDRQGAELRLSADPNRTTDVPGPEGELPRIRYFGDYELLEVIARGGMGVVYKARQASLNRVVALKMVLRGELATARDVARFRTEAEAAANLDHPHIVPIYEVGEYEGQQYYAMRYVEGASLARRPRSDARSEARLVAAVAGAVHHAHRRGVLHRDIKPSNILVDVAGSPLVADFGLAKRVDADRSLTESGAIVGTPRYMAPEQAAGRKDLTVAVDVYSLGVVLYERLTGHTPFTGETVLELLQQAREEEPPRPSSICPGLDRDLETICLKCLEKDPSKRYASAEALQDDLERWLRGEPIEARPVGKAERLWRWCRRNPVVAGLSAGLAAALLAGTAISITFSLRERQERIRAEQAEGIALAAQDDLEQALARSLFRPLRDSPSLRNNWALGDRDDSLKEVEAEALWELAENPGERLWLRFVEEGMRTSVTARQLSYRAEPAWIAAVGLDLEKRRRVEEILLERIQSADVSRRQQLDLATAALTLGDLAPVPFLRMTDLLVEGLANKDRVIAPDKIVDLADLLVGFTQRLEPSAAASILTRALEEETDPAVRKRLAQAMAAERMEPHEAARILLLALEKATDADERRELAQWLAAVAGRMQPREAARLLGQAAGTLIQALAKEKEEYHCSWLAQGLAAVAERMEPREATRVLVQELEKKTNANAMICDALAEGLYLVFGRMESHEAARLSGQVAGNLAQELENEPNANARYALAQGLAVVAVWMEPREAERLSGQAASILVLALENTTDANERRVLALRLAAVAKRIGPREAARLSGQATSILIQALEEEKDSYSRGFLAEGFAAVAAWMEPHEAIRVVALAKEKKTNADIHGYLDQALEAAVGRMEPVEAGRVLIRALADPTDAFARNVLAQTTTALQPTMSMRPTDAFARNSLAQRLAAVARRMELRKATQLSGQAASILLQALEKETTWNSRLWLAEGLAAVSAWMEPREAARLAGQAATILTQALEKETDPSVRNALAKGLAAVAASMEPREAARLAGQAAGILARTLEKETDAGIRKDLAEGLATVAGRLSRAEAATLCAPVMQMLLHDMATAKDDSERFRLVEVSAFLLPVLDNSEASCAAARMAFVVCSGRAMPNLGLEPIPGRGVSVFDVLDTSLTDNIRSEVRRRTAALAMVVGLANTTPLPALPALPAASEPFPCRLSTQDLVELLKMPTCFGSARKVVLKHLGNRYGRVFANHWEFVRFAQEQHLDLDLTSPPKRWRRP